MVPPCCCAEPAISSRVSVRSRRELAEADLHGRACEIHGGSDLDNHDNDVDVVVVREMRGTDNGICERIAAAGNNLPPALGPNRDGRELYARSFSAL